LFNINKKHNAIKTRRTSRSTNKRLKNYRATATGLVENAEKENVERGKYRKKMKRGKYRKGKYRRGKRRNDKYTE
jgi:hypothetical protein